VPIDEVGGALHGHSRGQQQEREEQQTFPQPVA
jgi:hypothetical protein